MTALAHTSESDCRTRTTSEHCTANESWTRTKYSYDSLYRLSTALTTGSTNYPQWGLSWGYDRYGNRLNQTLTAGSGYSGSVTVDATTNRIVQTTGTTYAYDANGNMTSDNLNTIVYDAENHSVSSSGSLGSGTYTYDGNGLRVKKVSGSTTTVYIFSGSKVIAEYDNGAAPSAPSREYVYGGSALLAKIDSTGTKYYHQDHLSNRLVTSSTGATVAQMGHYPYGESWYNASNDKLVFTSYERDAESGKDYAIARNYVSRLGRFASPDKLSGSVANPQSLNRYSYVLNNPGNLVDPSGQCGEMYDTKRHKKRLSYGEGGRELDYEDSEDFLASQDMPIDPCAGTGGGASGGSSGGGGGGATVDPLPSGTESVCTTYPGGTNCTNTGSGSGSGVGFSGPSLDNPYYNDPSNGPGIGDYSPILSIGGPGAGGGGQAPLSPKDFQRYLKLSQKALVDLFSKDCISFLTSKGIDVSQLASTILSQQAYNGSQSTITQGAAGVGITNPNQSIAQGFTNRPGVHAAASITANDVYFRQGGFLSGWFGNGNIGESTIEHEALHNYLRIGDPELQAQLGVPVNHSDTTNINQALGDHHCTH